MPNQATTLPTVEDLCLKYARNELKLAERDWADKQMSDDFAYSNGSKQLYEAPIQHWTAVINTLCEAFGLDRPMGLRYTTLLTPAVLDTIAKHHERAAHDAITQLDRFEEDYAETIATTHYEPYMWRLRNVKEAKRFANFYAYLCKRPHPFPGVDMLPENVEELD